MIKLEAINCPVGRNGLIELNLNFQPNIIPICLPQSDNSLVGQTGWVTGWGRLSEYGQISPVLREVHLPIISNSKCMRMYRYVCFVLYVCMYTYIV